MIVRFHKTALDNKSDIGKYIAEVYFAPDTALKFVDGLMLFAKRIGRYPESYNICNHKAFHEKGYRCATYKKK